MTARLLSALVLLVSVSPILVLADPAKDDPLPDGAKLRLGDPRLTSRYTPHFVLRPPEYKEILAPELNGEIRRFDVGTATPVDGKPDQGLGAGQVVVSADGKRALVARTGILVVKEVESGKTIQELKPPAGFITTIFSDMPALSFSSDGKFLAQPGGRLIGAGAPNQPNTDVIVWDVDRGVPAARIESIHRGMVLPLLSPDGKLLAIRPYARAFAPPGQETPDTSRMIQVWNLEKKQELASLRITGEGVHAPSAVFSPDGTWFAAAAADGPIDLWETKGWSHKATLLGRTGQGSRLAFSPDSKKLAAMATDGTVQSWSVNDGKPLDTTEPPVDPGTGLAYGLGYAPNGHVVAWGAHGHKPIAWETPTAKLLTPAVAHTMPVRSIAFGPNGDVLTCDVNRQIFRWDAAAGKLLGPVRLQPPRGAPSFLPLNMTLVDGGTTAAALGGSASIYDLETGKGSFVIPASRKTKATAHPLLCTGSKLVTLSLPLDERTPGECRVWDLARRQKTAEFELTLKAKVVGVPTVAMSPLGNRLVIVANSIDPQGRRSGLVVSGWDLKTGKKLGEVEDILGNGAVTVAALSETTAVVMNNTGRLRLYDYEDGKGGEEIEKACPIVEPPGPVMVSPDGKWFAAAFNGVEAGTFGVRIYDWPGTTLLHTFTGHRGPVTSLAVSHDGKTLASGSQDTTVLLWDLAKLGKQ
jgi:WD40 repeat protein